MAVSNISSTSYHLLVAQQESHKKNLFLNERCWKIVWRKKPGGQIFGRKVTRQKKQQD